MHSPFAISPPRPFRGFPFPAQFAAHFVLVLISLVFNGKIKSKRAAKAFPQIKPPQAK